MDAQLATPHSYADPRMPHTVHTYLYYALQLRTATAASRQAGQCWFSFTAV